MALLVLGALSKEMLEMALGPQGKEMLSLYLVSVQACARTHSLTGSKLIVAVFVIHSLP